VLRAEAAARPERSAWLRAGRSTEGSESFGFHVRAVVARLDGVAAAGPAALDALAGELAAVLQAPHPGRALWGCVMPGARAALESLRAQGLQLVAVSNSNGTVERGLTALGLRGFFSHVIDSGIVGIEKPDPRIFQHALASAGARAARTLHVGDLYDIDVTGARAAGLHALLLDPFGDWSEVDCERAADLGELARRIAAARA
jgi:HAD superfamily hydrolase (TIGR01509 family)